MPVKPWSYNKLPAKLNKLPVSVNKIPAKLTKLPVNLEWYGIELWRFQLIALRAHYTKKDVKRKKKDVEAHIHPPPAITKNQKKVFMLRHIKQILQGISLATTMLVSFLHSSVE